MPFDAIRERQHELTAFIDSLFKEPVPKTTNQKPLKVRAMFEKNQTLSNLKEKIKREKALEILSGKVNIISK